MKNNKLTKVEYITMCGIIGYTGRTQVLPKLFCGLKSLEYRGYDSAGIAFYDRKAGMLCLKEKGRVSEIEALADEYERKCGSSISTLHVPRFNCA